MNLNDDFDNKCAYVSAQKHVKQAMMDMESISDYELWDMLDECLRKLKQEAGKE